MSDPLLDPLLERIARSQQAGMRLGSVTAIDAGDASLTLDLAGDVIAGVRWIGSYTPVVDDVVVVSRVGAMWVCLGKLSKQIAVVPTTLYPSATVLPSTAWRSAYSAGGWYWNVADDGQAGQGVHQPYMVVERLTGLWNTSAVVTALPVGATVTAAKLRLTRQASVPGPFITPESTLVTPRLRMHTHSTIPTGAPTWTGSAWAPGTLTAGQVGVWDLPSTWLTALLAGTALGVGVDSAAWADYTWFSNIQLELSYSVPA